jgi:hypothetical protein
MKKRKPTGELELFKKIWAERDRVSFLSGKPLNFTPGTSFWFSCFAHVLSKAKNKYPEYMLNELNIILLTPEEHFLLDQGSERQREKYYEESGRTADWNKIYFWREFLKSEYKREHGK